MLPVLIKIFILWWLFVIHKADCQDLGKSQANSYFLLKQNGGYEYAFNTDTGLQSAQTADQSNEVTGHYMYYEKGVPFMVKYRAGVNGFQPEIVPAEKLMNTNTNSNFLDRNSLVARDLRTSVPSQQEVHGHQYSGPTATAKVSSFSIGGDTTLNFVQSALKTMQSQPMHMSFSSESGQVQHPTRPRSTNPSTATTTILQPVTRNDVQDINNLALLPPTTSNSLGESKHPYSFNYNADQSARSETSDPAGNVIGSYSYYDEAGYHDISYKANDDTGFVVLGGNLAKSQQPQRRQLFRSNNFNFNNYRIVPVAQDARLTTNALDERNLGKRSLRKFRRYAKW